jgi:hypothetical protein
VPRGWRGELHPREAGVPTHRLHPAALPITRRRLIYGAGATTATIMLAGCGGSETVSTQPNDTAGDDVALDYEPMFADYEASDEPDGDPDMVVWPEFVLGADPEIQELYAFHVTSGELMRYMPCFCGCTGSGHRNNRDCYIREVHADGSIAFDSMAPT